MWSGPTNTLSPLLVSSPSSRASLLASSTLGGSACFLTWYQWSPTVCPPFVPSHLCLTLCLRDPLCFHLLVVYSFSLLYSILIYYYHNAFFLLMDIWVFFLPIMNSDTMTTVFLLMPLLGYGFVQQKSFRSGCGNLHSYERCVKMAVARNLPQRLVSPAFFTLAVLIIVLYLFVAFSCISWYI